MNDMARHSFPVASGLGSEFVVRDLSRIRMTCQPQIPHCFAAVGYWRLNIHVVRPACALGIGAAAKGARRRRRPSDARRASRGGCPPRAAARDRHGGGRGGRRATRRANYVPSRALFRDRSASRTSGGGSGATAGATGPRCGPPWVTTALMAARCGQMGRGAETFTSEGSCGGGEGAVVAAQRGVLSRPSPHLCHLSPAPQRHHLCPSSFSHLSPRAAYHHVHTCPGDATRSATVPRRDRTAVGLGRAGGGAGADVTGAAAGPGESLSTCLR